jgi:hypothetical protein
MSLHHQLTRGLVALPVAAVLIAAGALSSAPREMATADCHRTAEVAPALPRAVDFHSMLPGALHIVKRVKVGEG